MWGNEYMKEQKVHYDNIVSEIQSGNYEKALELLLPLIEKDIYNDEIAVLSATINMACGMEEDGFNHIIKGLEYNHANYELYLMLADYYYQKNINLAYICYENAAYYCEQQMGNDNDDYRYIYEALVDCKEKANVLPLHICIVGKNSELVAICKDSINNTFDIEDNNIHVVKENVALNNCIEEIGTDCDVLILSDHVKLMPNSIYCMRMGLYSDANVGSVGAVSNQSNASSEIDFHSNNIDDYYNYAIENNLPKCNAFEIKTWLEGYAFMIRRSLFMDIGGLNTEYYGGMTVEYQDLCTKILEKGYRNILCWNSFVYCSLQGGAYALPDTASNRDKLESNIDIFKRRWGFHPGYYTQVRSDVLSLIDKDAKQIEVLEVGCGTGNTLGRVKKMFMHSEVKGIELVEEVALVGAKNFDITCGDIEKMELPYKKGQFDYIIFGDVLEHLREPWDVLKKVHPYLKKDGCVLTSIPNIMNASVLYNLICGDFTYEDSGILDRTHLRFFTYKEIIKMFMLNGYRVEEVYRNVVTDSTTDNYPELFSAILSVKGAASKEEFDTFQYIVKARKTNNIIT